MPVTQCIKEDEWVNENEAARIAGRAVQTLRNDRHKRKGIPYSKVGASVRYKRGDVIQFMHAHRITFDQQEGIND